MHLADDKALIIVGQVYLNRIVVLTNSGRLDPGKSTRLPSLPMLTSHAQIVNTIEGFMVQQRVDGRPVEILEAGCGNRWNLELGGLDYRLTGVDLDPHAVDIRINKHKDLDEAIVGDLRTVDLSDRKFDIVYSAFVLEHVPGAASVLERFAGWLKPRGLILIRLPDPHSVKGLVTRVTPHWFHVMYYRYVLGSAVAGNPGYAPYPTYYDKVVSRSGIREFVQRHGLELVAEFGTDPPHPGPRIVDRIVRACVNLIALVSLGRYSARHTDILYVLRTRS